MRHVTSSPGNQTVIVGPNCSQVTISSELFAIITPYLKPPFVAYLTTLSVTQALSIVGGTNGNWKGSAG